MVASNVEPVVQIDQLSHSFGVDASDKRVLYDITLALAPGEVVIMTGPSGSGKTTLLTLIGGLRSVQTGSLKVLDQQLAGLDNRDLIGIRRQIGFIFQGHNLFRSLTAHQNVKTALQLNPQLSGRQMDQLATSILEEVGLGHRMTYRTEQLSGGQKQRVAIARALVNRPKLILADEPTAALDRDTGQQVMLLLQTLAKENGSTIIIVTHDSRILNVADRMLNMVDGQIDSNVLVAESIIICEFLRRCTAFASLTPDRLTEIAERMSMEQHAAGQLIVRQGDVGDKFYLIREGSVDVLMKDENAPQGMRFVRIMVEGEYFGELALMNNQVRSATIIARENLTLYTLSKADFLKTLDLDSNFADKLRRVIFQRY
jgi:putative ABC transport system ATP-binding protein